MDEKALEKKFNKLMTKTTLKGVFKKVDTLDKCDVVLILYFDEHRCNNFLMTKNEFKERILPQYNEIINTDYCVLRYLKYTNPRHASNKLPVKLIDRAFF